MLFRLQNFHFIFYCIILQLTLDVSNPDEITGMTPKVQEHSSAEDEYKILVEVRKLIQIKRILSLLKFNQLHIYVISNLNY